MCQKLYRAAKSILAMPYYKNDHAQSGSTVNGHEDAVALKLKEAGFTEEQKTSFKKLKKKILQTWAETGVDTDLRVLLKDMPKGSFIVQPGSSQAFPDILIRDFDDRFIPFECKSVKSSGTPMWNDSLPRPYGVYILTSAKYNETTLFLGKDVISKEELDLMNEQSKVMKQIAEEYKKKLSKIDKFNRGFNQKLRKQHFQYGGNHKVDYFTHFDRKKCELNVLNFCK